MENGTTNKNRKRVTSLSFISICIFSIITVLNTSKFGATLSWLLLPFFLLPIGLLIERTPAKLKTNSLSVFLFWFSCLISTIISPVVEIQRDMITFFAFCLFYVLAVGRYYSKKDIHLIINIVILVATICSLGIIYNWFNGVYFNAWFKRSSFTFLGVNKDPNYVCAYIVPTIFFLFQRVLNVKFKSSKAINIVILSIMIVGCLLTGSRGALLVIGISFFIAIAFMKKMGLKIKLSISTILIIVIGYVVFTNYFPSQSIDRITTFSGDPRFELWDAAFHVFRKYPLFGGGMESASMFSILLAGNYSHNVYIDIVVNFGIVGSILFLLFLKLNILRVKKQDKDYFYSIFLAFLLPLFFINGFNTASLWFPLIFLTILSNFSISNETRLSDV